MMTTVTLPLPLAPSTLLHSGATAKDPRTEGTEGGQSRDVSSSRGLGLQGPVPPLLC